MGTNSSHPDVGETTPVDWKYISEGGATIVFSYVGHPHPHFDGMVLRLRKRDLTEPHFNAEGTEEPDDPQIAFQHEIMTRLIPEEHLPKLLTVRVKRPWLHSLALLHDNERPLKRRQVDQIDISRTKAVLATDLLGGKGALGIEIKPKWSFLPNPTYLSSDTKNIKRTTCRFCMHTHLRHVEEESTPGSVTYCPLDLFSRSPERVSRAIACLWDTWESTGGKANNLKVFADGKLVSPGDKHLLMTPPGPAKMPIPATEAIKASLVSALVKPLLDTPVLTILDKLERTLDAVDVEGVRKLWDASGRTQKMGHGEPQPDIQEWSSFVDTYLSKSQHHPASLDPQDLRYYLLSYLLSATFKDCSIIIRRTGPLDIVGLDKTVGVTSTVSVIDLDTKDIERVAKWEKLDQEIVHTYAKLAEGNRKKCIDDHSFWSE